MRICSSFLCTPLAFPIQTNTIFVTATSLLHSKLNTKPTQPFHTKKFISLSLPQTNNNFSECKAHLAFNSTQTNPHNQIQNENEYVVVNFYRFVFIKNPQDEINKHLSFLKGRDIHGRIYINEQGINAQYSGPSKDAFAYVEWLKEDFRFSNILVQTSPALNGHAFPKLKLRFKPSLVQLEGGISHLPLLDSSMRAVPLAPSEWRKRLEGDPSNSSVDSNYVLLDVRNELPCPNVSLWLKFHVRTSQLINDMVNNFSIANRFPKQILGYEWDIGHFNGAHRPDVDCFRSTSFGLPEREVIDSDPLANVDKNKTDIFMYCTGGIRCDVYSTILRQRGFKNLYTLKGGVSHYLQEEGPVGWLGNLFVFDDRLSLPPSAYLPEATTASSSSEQVVRPKSNSFAQCYICASEVSELRHRNCANLDCNLLFLCCLDCVKDLRGCCCLKCTTAPRLRPVLPGNQRYKKWHIYRERAVYPN